MGRPSRGTVLHPDRPCGPRCEICDELPTRGKFTHPIDHGNWDGLHHTPHTRQLDALACICWSCIRRLRTAPREGINPVTPTCAQCDCPVHCKVLCRKHYADVGTSMARTQCGICETRIGKDQRTCKSPNFASAKQILKSSMNVDIEDSDVFCIGLQTAGKPNIRS